MKNLLTFILFVFCSVSGFSQNTLYVFQTKGEVKTSENIPLKKGDEIKANTVVILNEKSSLTCIDKNGNTYINSKKGTYNLFGILKQKKKQKSSLTVAFFRYVWDEFIGNKEEKKVIGGVFRGKELMLYPSDSSIVVTTNLVLKWKKGNEEIPYYIFIKSEDEEDFVMIESSDSVMVLSEKIKVETHKNYTWTVSDKKFPNLNNLPHFSFRTISEKQYKSELKKYKSFVSDLKKLKLSEAEINAILCEEYKVCR